MSIDNKIEDILIENGVDKHIFGIEYVCLVGDLVDDLVTLFEDL